jgi:hypothetical protein
MSLNLHTFAMQPEHLVGVKQLYFCPPAGPAESPWAPSYYVEARIDYADVRSGYHMTCGLNHALDIDSCGEDLLWTSDMVRTVDPEAIRTARPADAQLTGLPGYVTEELLRRFEAQYLSFLLRHAEAHVHRNFALNIYSHPGETLSDFRMRCRDALGEAFRGELEAMREVVNRRFEHIEQKYLARYRDGEFESDRRMAKAKSHLHAVAEGIAQMFLRTELTAGTDEGSALRYPDPSRPDLEQSLEILDTDVRRDIRRLANSYQERVDNIDEYIIHPGLKDLHLVRKCILWMPAGAAKP